MNISHDEGSHFCKSCRSEWTLIGELNNRYYLVYDDRLELYLIGDIEQHADYIYGFEKKPTGDPFDIDEEAPDNDPRWEAYNVWYDQWSGERDEFKFPPNIAYDLVTSFIDTGWKQKKQGDLFFHILNIAARLIEKHEQTTTGVHPNTLEE